MAPGGPRADGCIFCDIVTRSAPSHVVYEDAHALAFLDIFPWTRGHLLVVPKAHVDRLTDLAPSEYTPLLAALAEVCRRVDRLSEHYNVSLNQGANAGQIVFHLHFHVIPRYGNDNPFAVHPRARLDDASARELVRELSRA